MLVNNDYDLGWGSVGICWGGYFGVGGGSGRLLLCIPGGCMRGCL